MTDIPASTKEGYAVFKHPTLQADKDHYTWYKVFGNLTDRRPLVILHGGPGGGHMSARRCFDTYSEITGTPIVYYDQIGCGNSTRLPDKKGDKSFWTPALFVAELDNLVRQLGIRDNFDLYGHSWGAKLAAKYAVSAEHSGSGLRKIVLSSGSANQKDLISAISRYIEALPQKKQELIHTCIADGRVDNHDYQLAVWEFLKIRMSPNVPCPKPGQRAMAPFVQDDVVYSTMLGQDPFHVNQGSLRTFDMTDECKAITQPVLLLSGEFEEDSLISPFFDGIPKAKWFVFSGSAHAAAADQPEKYRTVISQFLES